MVEVIGTQEFEDWFLELENPDAEAVARVVGLLEVKGTTLDYPYSSGIRGANLPCVNCVCKARENHCGCCMRLTQNDKRFC